MLGIQRGIARRGVLQAGGRALVGTGMLLLPVRWADAGVLPATPRQTEGPFYPVRLPLDRDNDLVQVEGQVREAGGIVTHLSGQVRDTAGRPLADTLVEIWQCDVNGVYRHPRAGRQAAKDAGFQGYGRIRTASDGAYRFRTIRPVPYYGRAPHIHVKVTPRRGPGLTTQMYVAGHPDNDRDFILNSIRSSTARERLIVPLGPVQGLDDPGALAGRFDLVLDSA